MSAWEFIGNVFSGLSCGALLALGITWCVALEADRRPPPPLPPGSLAAHYLGNGGRVLALADPRGPKNRERLESAAPRARPTGPQYQGE